MPRQPTRDLLHVIDEQDQPREGAAPSPDDPPPSADDGAPLGVFVTALVRPLSAWPT